MLSLHRHHVLCLCCALLAAVLLIPGTGVLAQGTPNADDPTGADQGPGCLIAFSKDFCTAELQGGTWGKDPCPNGQSQCNTFYWDDARLDGRWSSSVGTCGPGVPCDEAPDFGESIRGIFDLRAQRFNRCSARGSWDGPVDIFDPTGVLQAQGRLVGTLGMGTHRDTCAGSCKTGVCEKCHDAEQLFPGDRWRIGAEGTIEGRIFSGIYQGCTFTASLQGNWQANGDDGGPLGDAPDPWKFCGAVEGVIECDCTWKC